MNTGLGNSESDAMKWCANYALFLLCIVIVVHCSFCALVFLCTVLQAFGISDLNDILHNIDIFKYAYQLYLSVQAYIHNFIHVYWLRHCPAECPVTMWFIPFVCSPKITMTRVSQHLVVCPKNLIAVSYRVHLVQWRPGYRQ